jgi:BirA family biotin operon repressor/biotin-[acetyl-CoA-carboxylase] ligase
MIVCRSRSSIPWKLRRHLNTTTIGKKIYYYKEIDSTQTFAISMAEKKLYLLKDKEKKEYGDDIGNSHGTVVIAERQRKGRGRHTERKWFSPMGGIWLSVILAPKISAAQSTLFPIISAIAVSDTITEKTNLNSRIKWPNDIVIEGKKVAGILVDLSTEGEKINYAVIGIGINANVDFSKTTLAIVNNDGNSSEHLSRYTGVTSLKNELFNRSVDVSEMTQMLLEKLEHYYLKLESEGPENIRNEWKKRADTLGKVVKVRKQNEIVEGIAIGIDVDGILLVKAHDSSVHRLI